ncbi:MAG: hypothetical protein IKR67_06215 [Lachnospiraceae bacterium]|nr:hypothetical protein [Lachnospiraceae bacterium]
MTPENKAKFDAKVKRVEDAIALKEPDMVPIKPSAAIFPVLDAGYTNAQSIYDETLEIYRKSIFKYLNDFDPDCGIGVGNHYAGQGHLMEMMSPKNMRWAGMPGNVIDDNSIQQYIEYPFLEDDEFDYFFSDRTGWMLTKALPRLSTVTEPLAGFKFNHSSRGIEDLSAVLSKPEIKDMIQKLWEINEARAVFGKKAAAFAQEVEDAGYPIFLGGGAAVPFDSYSDFYRGTLNSLADLYERPEDVERFIDEQQEKTLAAIRATKGINDGKHVFMALHKGMDGFMSDEHYEHFYWRHLKEIIETIIEVGKVPYIYTEGKYNSRLKYLADVPPGKVFYHFETVDMAEAKKILGGIACISGCMSHTTLNFGTPEQVRDEAKYLIDTCAPGGGFIFETSSGLDYCSHKNVEVMFETVREYGKK